MSSTTQSHASLVEFGQKHVTKGLGRVVEAVITKGEGSYVTLGDGRQMLDFTCGIGVTNFGVYLHCSIRVGCAEYTDKVTVIRKLVKQLLISA